MADATKDSKAVLWIVLAVVIGLPCVAAAGLVLAGAVTSVLFVGARGTPPSRPPVVVAPAPAAAPSVTAELTVAIDATGALFVDGRSVTDEGLRAEARSAAARGRVTARIAADRDVAYARVITVMDLLRAEGVTQVSFLTAPAP